MLLHHAVLGGSRSTEEGKGGRGRARTTGRSELSPESESERAPPGARVRSPAIARNLGGKGGALCFHRVAPSRDALFRDAETKKARRRERACMRFRERKNMILGQLVERWPRATRKCGFAVGDIPSYTMLNVCIETRGALRCPALPRQG